MTLGALMALLLSSCSSDAEDSSQGDQGSTPSASPSPTPTPDARYGTVEQLRDAAVLAGFECRRWRLTNKVQTAAQSGECSATSVFSTYSSGRDLQAALRDLRMFDELFAEEDMAIEPRLIGPNWIINAPEAADLQPQLGGTVEGPS